MFDIILRYLYGFAKIHLRGIHINRFVNLCKARDIKLWDLEQKENEIFFFVASKDIAHLKEPALKTGSEVEILKEYGIRQFIRKNKKRIPFVIWSIYNRYLYGKFPFPVNQIIHRMRYYSISMNIMCRQELRNQK